MLQTRIPSPDLDAADSDIASLHDLFSATKSVVLRQYPIMLAVLLLTVILGGLYILTATREYTSTANLIIDSRKINMMQQSTAAADVPIESAMIDSQVEILKSETVALAVIKDLRLVDDPEFTGGRRGLVGSVVGFVSDLFAAPS